MQENNRLIGIKSWVIWMIFIGLIIVVLAFAGYGVSGASQYQSQAVSVIDGHPRTMINQSELDVAIARMTGATATEPYKSWFDTVVARETEARTNSSWQPSFVNLALMFAATGNTTYLDWYTANLDDYLSS